MQAVPRDATAHTVAFRALQRTMTESTVYRHVQPGVCIPVEGESTDQPNENMATSGANVPLSVKTCNVIAA